MKNLENELTKRFTAQMRLLIAEKKKDDEGYVLCPCCLTFDESTSYVFSEEKREDYVLCALPGGNLVLKNYDADPPELYTYLEHYNGCNQKMWNVESEDLVGGLILFYPREKTVLIGEKASKIYEEKVIKAVEKAARTAGMLCDLVEAMK